MMVPIAAATLLLILWEVRADRVRPLGGGVSGFRGPSSSGAATGDRTSAVPWPRLRRTPHRRGLRLAGLVGNSAEMTTPSPLPGSKDAARSSSRFSVSALI